MDKFLELAQSLYPNMPPDILQLFANEWSKTGDPNVAISNVRKTTAYDTAFPGNKRPDGSCELSGDMSMDLVVAIAERIALKPVNNLMESDPSNL